MSKYKFGIMLNGLHMQPWQLKVYDEILKTGLASCSLFILKNEETFPEKSIFKKISSPGLLFEQFKKSRLNNSLYLPISLDHMGQIPQITIHTLKVTSSSESFSEQDIETIQSHKLDFILRFGFGILKGNILQSAKWGIWSFHHGDEQLFRGGPPGFWEIFKGKKKQGTIFQQLTDKLDAGKILLKRNYTVISHSYVENVTKLLEQSVDMPAQALRMVDAGILHPNQIIPSKTNATIYRYPSNKQFIWFLLQLLLNKIKLKYTLWFKQENWILGYRTGSNEPYKYITPPKDGEYYADPFVFYDKKKPMIVAEHYSYKTQKGNIVLIEPGFNQVKTIIEKSTHLSYPFIFKDGEDLYLLPEEANSGSLQLYKWNFQEQTFHYSKTILNLPAVDASLLKHQEKYYLFTGLKGSLPNEKLYIFISDKLEGPYLPHLQNPVKVSPEGARMAGGFIDDNQMLLRPSQYSLHHYGEKIIFQKITKLSTTEYEEEFYSELKPQKEAPFNCGLHTYHKNINFEVIDLKKMKSTVASIMAKF